MLTLRRLRRALHAAAGSSVSSATANDQAQQLQCSQRSYVARNATGAPGTWTAAQPTRRHLHTTPLALGAASTSAASETNAKQAKAQAKRKNHLQWNVHYMLNVEKVPLPQVFDRLCSEIDTRGPSIRLRQAIDVFYYFCAQQEATLPSEFIARVVDYFEDSLLAPAKHKLTTHKTPLNESLNDGVFTAVVRLLVVQGNIERAWQLAHELTELGSGKMHFRSVAPILEHESRQGEFLSALKRWQELKTLEMEWTKTMEDTLIQMIIACKRHHSQDVDAVGPSSFQEHMEELLRDLGLATREISPDNASRLRHAFQSTGSTIKVLPSNDSVTPACGSCRTELQKIKPTEAERDKLVRAIENGVPLKMKNANISTKEFLLPFKRWLTSKHHKAKRSGKLHYILDGPNLAYLNQNFDNGSFRFDHVDLVARQLQSEGHEVSITIPFSYLEDSSRLYIRTRKAKEMRRKGKVATRQRSPEDKATIERWREENLLFSCRTDYLSDDIFWLYASALLGDESLVVTNDQGRDHVFALLNHRTSGMTTTDLNDENRVSMDLLDRWRESAIVNIEIQHGELTPEQKAELESIQETEDDMVNDKGVIIPVEDVRLIHPAPFSRTPQISADGQHLHFPIADFAGSGHTKWLCIHPPATASN